MKGKPWTRSSTGPNSPSKWQSCCCDRRLSTPACAAVFSSTGRAKPVSPRSSPRMSFPDQEGKVEFEKLRLLGPLAQLIFARICQRPRPSHRRSVLSWCQIRSCARSGCASTRTARTSSTGHRNCSSYPNSQIGQAVPGHGVVVGSKLLYWRAAALKLTIP